MLRLCPVPAEPLEKEGDNQKVIARRAILGKNCRYLKPNELKKFRIVHHVSLVKADNNIGDVDLAGQEDVLPCLRHRTVSSRYYQHRSVHLGSSGDHVLDVASMPPAVQMRIMPLLGLILRTIDVDRDAAFPLFRCTVDLIIGRILGPTLGRKSRGDCRSQRGLAMVNVTNSANVYVRLRSLKPLLSRCCPCCGFVSSSKTATT